MVGTRTEQLWTIRIQNGFGIRAPTVSVKLNCVRWHTHPPEKPTKYSKYRPTSRPILVTLTCKRLSKTINQNSPKAIQNITQQVVKLYSRGGLGGRATMMFKHSCLFLLYLAFGEALNSTWEWGNPSDKAPQTNPDSQPRSEPAPELYSRAASSVGVTSPFQRSQHRKQFLMIIIK